MTTGRTLKVTIVGDSKDAERAVRELEISMGNLDRTAVRTGAAAGAGFAAVTKGIDLLIEGGRRAIGVGVDLLNSYRESERAGSRLDAVLKATGNTLGTTREDMLAYSTELQHATGIADEAVTGVQTVLLTFKEVGPDVFKRTTEAALDMSAVFGQDASSSAITLGKALQDPIAGVTALRRVGIQLSDAQEAQLRKFAEVNDILGAQKLILQEVEGQVGGTARAMGEDGTGKTDRFREAIGDLKETLGEAIADGMQPLLDSAVEWAESEDAAEFTRNLADDMRDLAGAVGSVAGALRDAKDSGLGQFIGWFAGHAISGAQAPFKIAGELKTLAGQIGSGIQSANAPDTDTLSWFLQHPEQFSEAQAATIRGYLNANGPEGEIFDTPLTVRASRTAPAKRTTTFGLPPKSVGGSGSAPTMFGADGLATIAGYIGRTPGSPGATDVTGYDAALLGFKNLQRELKEDMLALGLTMADLDARGLEQTDTFKGLDEQMKVLRDASGRLRDIEELRLGTIAESIAATRELEQAQKEQAAEMRRIADELYAKLNAGGNLSAASSRGAFLAAAAAARGLEGETETDANGTPTGRFTPKGGGTFDGTTLTRMGPGASTIQNLGTIVQVFPGVQAEAAAIAAAGATE
ncbi:MAG: phage tail length tape measure family protein [Dehalococcoidia bacterium]